MYAKVKEDSKIKNVTACAGTQFSKLHWELVPPDREDEAKNNPYLETAETIPVGDLGAAEVESPAIPSDAPVGDSPLDSDEEEKQEEKPEPKPKPKTRRRTTRKKTS